MPRPVSARKQAAAAALAVAVAVPPPPPPPSCRSRRGGRLLMLVMLMLLAVASRGTMAHPRNIEGVPYATAYACEGKTLKIECREGEIIHLIRANYGRFSITICNDHGNTDWSVNCMSTKSLRVLHGRCSMNQNCSILASTTMFGDPCVSTLKYLEAHYQCIPTTMSSTPRPSPPWLITSKPVVWGSTGAPRTVDPVQPAVPAAAPPAAAAAPAASAGGHLQPPTFRPHITMPPDLRPGVVKVKNDGHSPELAKPAGKPPAETPAVPDVRTERTQPTTREDVTEKPFRKEEELPVVRVGDREGVLPAPPREGDPVVDPNRRHHHHTHYDSPQPPEIALWRHCAPALARGLAWNWTSVGEVAVQPCPGGATGLARWRCVSSAHRLSHLQQQRRAGAPHREPSGSHAPLSDNPRQLNSRDPVIHPDMTDFREELENLNLPVPLASSGDLDASTIHNTFDSDGQPVWISENPDLSECRSVWLNSLETRVKEGESLLSISNDLAQVTSSKTLYGGDMMTTTNIMKRLAQRMALNIQSFPDPRQREAIVSDMLLGVVKTGSHLLDISQQASWKDLSHPAQMRVATSLLIGLEENAFLLAEAVLREKTIIQQVDNILLSVRVLETRNVETEEFPSSQSKDQWMVSQDSIYLPRGALIDNSEGGLVRIVFVAFDRLEEILQPPESPTPPPTVPTTVSPHQGGQQHANMNRDRVKDNITRIINSKVISASLGKGRHIQLSQPVRLTLRHLRTHNVTNPTCVFWDYTINVWSSEGCRVEWSNLTHTGCQCSHLTNFALLMDVHAVALGEVHALALHIITLVGCSVSCVALAAAMLVFHLCKGMKSDRITIHKNLCLCLLLAELVFMFGVERTGNRVLCGVIAATLHYLFLAAFAWMLLEGYHLYAMLVEVFEPERARARWYYLVGYLGPLLVVGASAAADYSSYGTSQHCWLRSDNYFILSFIVPVAVVLLANWICLMMVIYMMCQHSNVSLKDKENDKQKKIKVWLKSSTFLVVVLGLTWTFGLLYLNQETILMAYLFTIFNTLQGLFIFICHCLLNENFLKECSRHRWLACCAWLLPAAGASAASGTQSSNAAAPTQPGGTSKRPRHHQAEPDQCLEDVSDHRPERALKQAWSGGNTCTRPSAPLYSPAAHSCSMPTMAANQQASKYEANRPDTNFTTMSRHESSNISRHDSNGPRTATPVPAELDYGQGEAASRSRSPSCFSVKMDVSGWGVVQNPLSAAGGPGVTGTWKSTSSRQGGGTMNRDRGLADSRSYNYSRNYAHNYPHSNTYSEIGREREFQPIHRADDPVYEEIDRNETLMSDVSDDNSVHRVRPTAHHQSVMDRRPLIAQNNIDHRNRYDQYYQVHGQRYVDDARHYGHAVDAHYRRNMEVVLDGDDVASRVLHNRQIPPYNGC